MKRITVVFFALIVSSVGADAAERRIAFERNNAVYVANLDGSGEKKIASGTFPAISPDATRVAFTVVEKTGETYIRHIAVADIASGNVTIFNDAPSTNVYYSSWSPDGKRVLFTLRRNELWEIVSTAADGSDFKVIMKGEPDAVTLYSPCWARDGQSIFCQNMTNIYHIALDGHELAHWEIHKIIRNGDMSGDGRIDVSPDGKRLLLSVDMGEESNRKNWDGPVPALWMFDIATQKATRITPKSLFGWDGCWLDNNNVLFRSQVAREKESSIYRVSTKGKNAKQLITKAQFPTVSAP